MPERLMKEIVGDTRDARERLAVVTSDLHQTPNQPRLHAERVLLLESLQERDKADRAVKVALRILPRSELVHVVAGALQLARGDKLRAIEHANHAIELNPSMPVAWRLLARALEQVGGRREAKAAMHKADLLTAMESSESDPLHELFWSTHPILSPVYQVEQFVARASFGKKWTIRLAFILPAVTLLTWIEVMVADFPIPFLFPVLLVPALIIAHFWERISDAMVVTRPAAWFLMSPPRRAAVIWVPTLLIVFAALVVVQARGHGGGPLIWLAFFSSSLISALATGAPKIKLRNVWIHGIGLISATSSTLGALLTTR